MKLIPYNGIELIYIQMNQFYYVVIALVINYENDKQVYDECAK